MIPLDICLISATRPDYVDRCPWRRNLIERGIEFKDLNYHGCDDDGRQAALDPLNTWHGENPLTPADLPFVIYKLAVRGEDEPRVVIHRKLKDLKEDNVLDAGDL